MEVARPAKGSPPGVVELFDFFRAAEGFEHLVDDLHQRFPARRMIRPPLVTYLRRKFSEQRELRDGAVQSAKASQLGCDGQGQSGEAFEVSLEFAAVEFNGFVAANGQLRPVRIDHRRGVQLPFGPIFANLPKRRSGEGCQANELDARPTAVQSTPGFERAPWLCAQAIPRRL